MASFSRVDQVSFLKCCLSLVSRSPFPLAFPSQCLRDDSFLLLNFVFVNYWCFFGLCPGCLFFLFCTLTLTRVISPFAIASTVPCVLMSSNLFLQLGNGNRHDSRGPTGEKTLLHLPSELPAFVSSSLFSMHTSMSIGPLTLKGYLSLNPRPLTFP